MIAVELPVIFYPVTEQNYKTVFGLSLTSHYLMAQNRLQSLNTSISIFIIDLGFPLLIVDLALHKCNAWYLGLSSAPK